MKERGEDLPTIAQTVLSIHPPLAFHLLKTAQEAGQDISTFNFAELAKQYEGNDPDSCVMAIALHIKCGGKAQDCPDLAKIARHYYQSRPQTTLAALQTILKSDPSCLRMVLNLVEECQITDQTSLNALVLTAAATQVAFARFIGDFRIDDPDVRAEVAVLSVERAPGLTISEVHSFELSNRGMDRFTSAVIRLGHSRHMLLNCTLTDQEQLLKLILAAVEGENGLENMIDVVRTRQLEIPQAGRFDVLCRGLNESTLSGCYHHDAVRIFSELQLDPVNFEQIKTWLQSCFSEGLAAHLVTEIKSITNPVAQKRVLLWLVNTVQVLLTRSINEQQKSWIETEKLLLKILKMVNFEIRYALSRYLVACPLDQYNSLINRPSFAHLCCLPVALLLKQGVAAKTCQTLAYLIAKTKGNNRDLLFQEDENIKVALRLLITCIDTDIDTAIKGHLLSAMEVRGTHLVDQFRQLTALLRFHGICQFLQKELSCETLGGYSQERLLQLKNTEQYRPFIVQLIQQIVEMTEMSNFVDDFNRTFGLFRDPFAIVSLAGRILSSDQDESKIALKTFISCILHNTYRQKRYETSCPHIDALKETLNKGQWETWMKGASRQEGEWTVVDTDDPCDLLLCGTEVAGSCLDVEGDPDYSRCVLGYLLDGKTRMIALKNDRGQIVARCMIRLLIDQEIQRCVLVQEKIYPVAVSRHEETLLMQMAEERSQRIQIPLLRHQSSGDVYRGTVASLSSPCSEYVDSIQDTSEDGIYEISDLKIVRQ